MVWVILVCICSVCLDENMSMSLPFPSTPWPQMPSSLATLRTGTVKARWTARFPTLRGFSGTSPQRYIHPVKCVCLCMCVSFETLYIDSLTVAVVIATRHTTHISIRLWSYRTFLWTCLNVSILSLVPGCISRHKSHDVSSPTLVAHVVWTHLRMTN